MFDFSLQGIIKLISFLFGISIFFSGIFFILFKIFSYLIKEEFIGEVIIFRLVSITFTSFLFFLIISNIITSLSTFFRSPEVEYLFSLPFSFKKIFALRLFENIIYASWASLIVDIPIIIALGISYNTNIQFYFIAFFALLVFLIITSSVGIFLIFILIPNFLKLSKIKFTIIIISIFSIILIFFLSSRLNTLLKVPDIKTMNDIFIYIKSVELPAFRYLPSEYLTSIFQHSVLKTNNWIKPFFILSIYLLFGIILLTISSRKYKDNFQKIPLSSQFNKLLNTHFPKFKNLKFKLIRILIYKDIIIFFRNPMQWGQSLIMILLMLVYLFGIINSSFNIQIPLFMTFVSFANLAFISYLMVTISVRFSYPSISLEGNSFWFLRTYTDIKILIFSKYLSNFIIIFLIGILLTSISNIFLNISRIIYILSLVNISLFSFGITGINIGIGCLFPNFKEKNPSKLAAGPGGFISAIVSLFYLFSSLLILNQWSYQYFSTTFFYGGKINYSLLIVCQTIVFIETILFSILLPYWGYRKLKYINL